MQWDSPFSPRDVLNLLGIYPNKEGGEFQCNCPFHKDNGKHLSINLSKGTFKCWSSSCNERGGIIQFYSKITGKTSKEAYKDILNKLNINSSSFYEEKKRTLKKMNVKHEVPMKGLLERNAVYTALLDMLTLSDKHMQHLSKERCLSKEYIEYRRYKSVPQGNEEQIAQALIAKGFNLAGIPGFHLNDKTQRWELKANKEGILIPMINFNGYIQGFQIRRDNPPIINGKVKGKYIWLSSKPKDEYDGYSMGCSSSSFFNFACNYKYDNVIHKQVPLIKNEMFAITEGPIKADIFYYLTGNNIIGIPGVNCYEQLVVIVKWLSDLGVRTIYNLLDMDAETNSDVAFAVKKINELCLNHGIQVIRPVWPSQFKGIDDYYIAKLKVKQ